MMSFLVIKRIRLVTAGDRSFAHIAPCPCHELPYSLRTPNSEGTLKTLFLDNCTSKIFQYLQYIMYYWIILLVIKCVTRLWAPRKYGAIWISLLLSLLSLFYVWDFSCWLLLLPVNRDTCYTCQYLLIPVLYLLIPFQSFWVKLAMIKNCFLSVVVCITTADRSSW